MSAGKTFLARFLGEQRAKGAHRSPLLATLEKLAQAEPQPQDPAPAWLVTPEELEADQINRPARALRTVQQLTAERLTARAPFKSDAPPVAVRLVQTGEQAVRTLTACLDDAPCRESARKIFRALFMLALEVARAGGGLRVATVRRTGISPFLFA